jgi:hypothetical protein
LTQRLLPRQALPLEHDPSLSESSLLLLELGLRLLASGPFLTELLLRCGERLGLARQGSPQPVRLLGLLLGLALPGPRSLEGRVVLLELGAGSDDLDLPRRLLMVNSCIKVCLDLQVDKSPVVVKGPFFPRVGNPRYRIRGTMCNARIQSSKAMKAIFDESNFI